MKRIYTRIRDVPFSEPLEQRFLQGYEKTASVYKFRLTEHLRKIIDRTKNEGLKKQFLPQVEELLRTATEFEDVADEISHTPVPGVVHLYPTKVLLMLTLNCPTYCRFCFRKEKLHDPRGRKMLNRQQLDSAFQYIRNHDIDEVILSGGDPFFCPDSLIKETVDRLIEFPRVTIIRYHTRLFTFDPDRISDTLLSNIIRKETTFIVMHINQAEEISPEMELAVQRCLNSGIPLFSQTALLAGVNDDYNSLKELFTRLIQLRIKPYYLFHPDPSYGLGHFRIKLKTGIELYRSLFNRISGLAIPIYLFNVPGGNGHIILDLGNVHQIDENKYEITSWKGDVVTYYDY